MSFANKLKNFVRTHVERPTAATDIRKNVFYVYILTINDSPVVVGHGKLNRAKVIFDSNEVITADHIKAMNIRLHNLCGPSDAVYERYLIPCTNKEEAKNVEKAIHDEFGGNTRDLPEAIQEKLFSGLHEKSIARMVLRMALCSSFDGIGDLKRWRRAGILEDETWKEIAGRLHL